MSDPFEEKEFQDLIGAIDAVNKENNSISPPKYFASYCNTQKQKSIDDRMKEIKLEDAKQDVDLKRLVAKFLISVLITETVALFAIVFFQGFGIFSIDEWSLRTLVGATLLQTYGMLKIVVEYLFSKPGENKK